MMMHALKHPLGLALLLAGTGLAQAACPPLATGDTAAAIAANQQRLICLQNQISDSAVQAKRELDLKVMQDQLQTLQLQRRFDMLPKPMPTPVF
jgi:hypothetical protein